jgi:hypothetical protein
MANLFVGVSGYEAFFSGGYHKWEQPPALLNARSKVDLFSADLFSLKPAIFFPDFRYIGFAILPGIRGVFPAKPLFL